MRSQERPHFAIIYDMQTPNHLRIACRTPESLATRITKAPFRVIYDSGELGPLGYQDEGVIVPELEKSEPLSSAELAHLAIDLDAPDALRLVKVPQRTNAFMQALGRSGLLFESGLGAVTNAGMTSLAQAHPGKICTTINPAIGRYVGLHIDAMTPGEDLCQMMMGVACSEGGRGLTFCPSITADVISEDLRYAQNPADRLARREQIRRAAAELQGSVVCYTLWLEGSSPNAETYEAYANFQPHNMLHDGTAYRATQPAAVQLMNTGSVGPGSFKSVV